LPNIIIDLHGEIARVESLLPKLSAGKLREAEQALRCAREFMAMNQYEGMREALDDLREVKGPKK
jgi:hypothetical protein